MGREFNVLALIKGEEHYVYVYDDDSRAPLLETFRTQADDPNLSLNWFDAAVLSQKADEQLAGAPLPPRHRARLASGGRQPPVEP